MVLRKQILNSDNDRVFDVIMLEDGTPEIQVKTGKGRGEQAFRSIKVEEAFTKIQEALNELS